MNNGAEATFESLAWETHSGRLLVFLGGRENLGSKEILAVCGPQDVSLVSSGARNLTLVLKGAPQFPTTARAFFLLPPNRKTFRHFQNLPIANLTPLPGMLGMPSSEPLVEHKAVRTRELSGNCGEDRGTLGNSGLLSENGCS
jgi:hypothetical protein